MLSRFFLIRFGFDLHQRRNRDRLTWFGAVPALLLLMAVGQAMIALPSRFRNGHSRNQQQVVAGMNHVIDTRWYTVAELLPVIPYAPARENALVNSLSGEIYASIPTIGLQVAGNSLRTVSNRIINTDLFLNVADEPLLGAATGLSTESDLVVRGQPSVSFASGWLQGYGVSGRFGSDGNASSSGYGIGGLAYGLDLGRDETGVIGITLGNSFTSISNGQSDTARVNSLQVGIYALKRNEISYAFGVLNYGHNLFDVNRTVGVTPTKFVVGSSYSGDQFGSYGEAGLNVESRNVRMQPFVGMQYVSLSNSQTSESGLGGLSIAASNFSSVQAHLGGRLIAHRLTDSRGWRWTPYLSGRWAWELLNEQASTFATLQTTSASWTIAGNQPARNFGLIGPGLTVELSRGISLFGAYEFQWGSNFRAQTGTGGLLITY